MESAIVLQPHTRAFLDALAALGPPQYDALPLAKARALMNEGMVRLGGAGEAVARVANLTMPGPHGPIPLRVYTPEGTGPFGVVVFYHGGGFVIGGLDEYDAVVRRVVNASGAIVVSVDYRLAPEHPFPIQVDETYAALAWIAEHAAEFGGDPTRVAVAGDSAGGYMAATAALIARDRGAPTLALQALVYPKTDTREHYASYDRYGTGLYLTWDLMQWFDRALFPNAALKTSRYAAPLRERLDGLAPAAIVLAECDPLFDEGVAYARALEAAGVSATLRVFPGVVHGFFSIPNVFPEAVAASTELGASIRAAFART